MGNKETNNIEFHFEYSTQVSDLWQLSMYYAYSSYLATINLVCIVSSIALLVRFHDTAKWLGITCMVFFVLLFTVIQPLGIYRRAKNQLAGNEKDVTLDFTHDGMVIRCDGQKQTKHWHEIKQVLIKPTLVAIYVSKTEGYILTNRVLGDQRRDFIEFVSVLKD